MGNSIENNRLQIIIQAKDDINSLTHELLEITTGRQWNYLEVKKKITTILSKISLMTTVAKSTNYDTNPFLVLANELFKVVDVLARPLTFMDKSEMEFKELLMNFTLNATREKIGIFCNYANVIAFDMRKQKLILPKIDFSIFKL